MKKKMFDLVCTLVLMVSMFCFIPQIEVNAISQSNVQAKLQTLMDQYNGKTANSNQMYMGSQCKGFANWVFLNIFGVYIGPYPESANYMISNPQAEEIGVIPPGSLNETSSRALLQKAAPGDYIQVQRSVAHSNGKCGPHSMIVVGVRNDGVEVFDCNSDGRNTIKRYLYTWSKFDYQNRAMSLYRAQNYEYGYNPEGVVESVSGTTRSIRVVGWAIDKDKKAESLKIHVYIGGPAGVGEGHVINADEYRPDVPINCGDSSIGNYHGFNNTINTSKTGKQDVYVYAINVGDGTDNTLLGQASVFITEQPSGYRCVSDGEYHIVSALDKKKTLTVENKSKQTGANIQLWNSIDEPEQVFNVKYLGDGYYQITSRHSGLSLDVTDSGTASGTNLQQCTVFNNDAQKWVIKPAGDGKFFNIVSKCNGLYIDVTNGVNANGTNIQMCNGNGEAPQKWRFVACGDNVGKTVSDGSYHIVSALDSNRTITVAEKSKLTGANIQLWNSINEPEQVFNVKYLGKGYYSIVNKNSNLSLDVEDGKTISGTNIQQCTVFNNDPQKWIIKKSEKENYYYIVSKCNGLYVDVANAVNADGTNIWACIGNKSSAQKWKFVPEEQHKHNYVQSIVRNATCSQTGLKTYTCSVCGDKYTEAVPMTGHTAVTDKGRAATCTGTGLTEGSHCSKCKTVLVAQKQIAAKGHTAVTDKGRAATCTKTGLTEGSHCSKCKTVLVAQKQIAAKGHTAVADKGRAATCTEVGLTEGSHCSKCKTVLVAQKQIAAKGHTVVTDKGRAATCTKTGLTEGSHCSKCKTVLVAQKQIAVKGHTAVTDKGRAATCTKTGLTEGSHCSKCKTVLVAQKQIAAKGHTVVTDKGRTATCTGTGLTEGSHCSKCKAVLVAQKQIAAKGHTAVTDKGRAATCTKTGLTEGSHCSVCGTILKAQETIKKKGHVAEKKMRNVIKATCTKKGYSGDTYCQACDQLIKKGKDIPCSGHTGEAKKRNVVKATCVKEGYTGDIYCKTCGEMISSGTTIAKTKHQWDAGKVTTQPTGVKKGVKTYICKKCKTCRKESIKATGLKPGMKIKDAKSNGIYKVAKDGLSVEYTTPINKKKTSVLIPDVVKYKGVTCKVTSIGANAFKGNKYIKQAKIGNNVVNIEKGSFSGCQKLSTVTFGKKVASIGNNAFFKDTALAKLTLPASVKSIGSNAFADCKNLKNITIKTKMLTNKSVGAKAFKGTNSKPTISVPKSVYASYRKLLKTKGMSGKAKYKKF